MESNYLQRLAEKTITTEELLKAVELDFALLPFIISGVSSPKASVRYGCAKILVDLSRKQPEKLYPNFDIFLSLLDSRYRILVWNALAAIANLCTVDTNKKFDAMIDKYYGFIDDEYMVTVANVVGNSAKIALAKPYLVPKITEELLRIDRIHTSPHLTDECKRVIAQQAVEAFDKFFNLMNVQEKAKVISFAKKHADSSRTLLKKEATLFLERWGS